MIYFILHLILLSTILISTKKLTEYKSQYFTHEIWRQLSYICMLCTILPEHSSENSYDVFIWWLAITMTIGNLSMCAYKEYIISKCKAIDVHMFIKDVEAGKIYYRSNQLRFYKSKHWGDVFSKTHYGNDEQKVRLTKNATLKVLNDISIIQKINEKPKNN